MVINDIWRKLLRGIPNNQDKLVRKSIESEMDDQIDVRNLIRIPRMIGGWGNLKRQIQISVVSAKRRRKYYLTWIPNIKN